MKVDQKSIHLLQRINHPKFNCVNEQKYSPGVVHDRAIHIAIRLNSALWFMAFL